MESLPEDSPLRKAYPVDIYTNGGYFPSPNGRVRYWVVGPQSGDKVALIHGISVPSIAYQKVAQHLVDKGFQVLLYDLHGRGYSEAPGRVLESSDYAIQLALLLQYVGWNAAKIVGFSMGGGVAAAFASLFPHLVNGKVVFVSSAGLIELPTDENGIRQPTQPRRSDNPDSLAVELRQLQGELLPGFKKILGDDMQYGPIAGLDWAFKKLSGLQTNAGTLQILIIHGTDDDIVPFTEAIKIHRHIPEAKLAKIEGATHYLVVEEEHWLTVAENISGFL